MQKITPFLWFDDKAEEAMNFYVSLFKNSKVLGVTRYGEAGPGPKGSVLYRTVYNIAGCYIAARLAPDRPMAHSLALGIVGLVVSTAGSCGNVEPRTHLRTSMVPTSAHRDRDTVRLGGRQTSRDAGGRTR